MHRSCCRRWTRISIQPVSRHLFRRPCSSLPPEDSYILNSELPRPKLDYTAIVENLPSKLANAHLRNAPIDRTALSSLPSLHTSYKTHLRTLNSLRQTQNILGHEIQKATREKDTTKRNELLERAKELKTSSSETEKSLADLDLRLLSLALTLPNDTHPAVPPGPESSARPLSEHGPPPLPATPAREHTTLSNHLNLVDFASGATVTGSSWYFLTHEAALLEMALTRYAMTMALQHGFTPVITPDVVRADVAARCGFAPRESGGAASQMYHLTTNGHASSSATMTAMTPELVLAGTAEIPLAGLFANRIIPSDQLPLRVVGMGHAFRSEAGASKESRGLYRVHQFTKVELFAVTKGDESETMMEEMRGLQRKILEGLGLSFRVLDMPTEELGASAYRKYDMEAWMPGRGAWGEVSSLSNCTDYQSRRLHIRYRPLTPKGTVIPPSSSENHPQAQATKKDTATLPFAHTLNGTAAAIPRLIVALVENGAVFGEDGKVECLRLPQALKPHWIENGRGFVRWQGED